MRNGGAESIHLSVFVQRWNLQMKKMAKTATATTTTKSKMQFHPKWFDEAANYQLLRDSIFSAQEDTRAKPLYLTHT